MKKIILPLLALSLMFGVTACGGNADADKFCECFKKFEAGDEDDACEKDMEAMEDAFKKDKARLEAFQEAARKQCPEAEKYIKRME